MLHSFMASSTIIFIVYPKNIYYFFYFVIFCENK